MKTNNKSTKTAPRQTALNIASVFNLGLVPEEEWERQYIELDICATRLFRPSFMYVGHGKILKGHFSDERAKRDIQGVFQLKDWQFATVHTANGIRFAVLYPGIRGNTKLLREAISACGWTLTMKGSMVRKGKRWRAMGFEPSSKFFPDDGPPISELVERGLDELVMSIEEFMWQHERENLYQ